MPDTEYQLEISSQEVLGAYAWLIVSGLLLLACIGISVGGVYWAVCHTHCEADGGRGGAIACALALFVAFLTPRHSASLYESLSTFAPTKVAAASSDEERARNAAVGEVQRFKKLLEADARIQFIQGVCIAFATAISTLTWGFGDLIVRHYIGKCPSQ